VEIGEDAFHGQQSAQFDHPLPSTMHAAREGPPAAGLSTDHAERLQ